jgi:hypothetical protein
LSYTFSSIEDLNRLLQAVERVAEVTDIDATDAAATIIALLSNGWVVTPPAHLDDASSSSPVTDPSTQQFQD